MSGYLDNATVFFFLKKQNNILFKWLRSAQAYRTRSTCQGQSSDACAATLNVVISSWSKLILERATHHIATLNFVPEPILDVIVN